MITSIYCIIVAACAQINLPVYETNRGKHLLLRKFEYVEG